MKILGSNRWKILIGITVVCALAVYPCLKFMDKKEAYTLDSKAYQVVNSTKVFYPEGTTFIAEDEDRILAKQLKKEITATPIYMTKEERTIIPKNYAVVFPENSGRMYRLSVFSEVFRENYGTYAYCGGDKIRLEDCFLFDGEDTYLFLDETEISYGETSVKVSAFSFVTATYQQEGQLYAYSSDKYQTIPADSGNVTANIGGKYVLCLDLDYLQNGKEQQLLYGSPEKLKDLK